MRLAQLAMSRSDVFNIPRTMLTIRDGFNVRYDIGDDFPELVQSIRENGIKQPLSGHKDKEDRFLITDGHRRCTAIGVAVEQIETDLEAAKAAEDKTQIARYKEQLARLESIPVMAEPQGYEDKDRDFDIALYNGGKPLNLLEEALLFGRLMAVHHVSESEILRRTGRSLTHFQNCMLLVNAPDMHDYVKAGKLTPSLAIEIIRKVKTADQRRAVVEEGIRNAAHNGREKVTARHLDADTREEVAPPKTKAIPFSPVNAVAGDVDPGDVAPWDVDPGGDDPAGLNVASHKSHRLDAIVVAGDADPEPKSFFNPKELRSKVNKLLSTVFDPKLKVDGSIMTAVLPFNGSYFYQLSIEAPKASHTSPWRACRVVSCEDTPRISTVGFDTREGAESAAWKEIADFLLRTNAAGKKTPQAVEAIKAVLAELDGEEEFAAPESPDEAPPSPHDVEDEAPENDTLALHHLRRVFLELGQTGGIKKRNERFLSMAFLSEYIDGRHTHNQLRAFVLYGSPETRDLHREET